MDKRMSKRGGRVTSAIALEPRMMFDAAAMATAAETIHQVEGQIADNSPDAAISTLLSALADVPAAAPAGSSDPKVVVVVDTSVKDYQSLIDGMAPGAELILIDASSSGVDQLASALAGRTDIDALHIISHGSQGSVTLGTDTLSMSNLASHDADLAIIAGAMAEDGDILLYGCLVGNGEGADFVEALAIKTGADIAASDDPTGTASRGGDWDLEVRLGDIEAMPAISAEKMAAYSDLLGLPNGSQTLSSLFTTGIGTKVVINNSGVWDTYPQWTDGYFILSGGNSSGPLTIGLQGFDPWLGQNAPGSGYFKVVSNGTTLSTFQLFSLTVNGSGTFTGVQVTAYTAAGGTLTNSSVSVNSTYSLDVSGFSGTDLTGFRIDFSSTGSIWFMYLQSFSVQGASAPALPEIAVSGNSNNITDGDTTPSTTDHTDFGSTAVAGGTVERTYTISNTGPGTLNISSITLSNTTDFSFVGSNPTSIASGQTGTVTVRFDPASAGAKTSTLTINSNDSDEAVFNFNLTGTGVTGPIISSATYNASTNVLTVTGDSLTNGGAIDETKLTLTGQGGSTYTLTETGAITASSTTSFSITLNATDQLHVEGLLNNNGTSSAGSTTYNLAGAADWHGTGNADLTGNAVTVSNVQTPTITSSTYNATTGVLTVTGTNLVRQSGDTNDIDLSKLTFTGQGGTYTLTTATDVEITDATTFTATLSGADKTGVDALLDANGTASSGNTTYNIAAADDWNGPITGGSIADATSSITVSGVNNAPSAGGDVTVTAAGTGNAVSILEDASPNAANIRLTPTTLSDTEDGTPTQVRILSVTGGTLLQGDGSAITTGASGTLLTLTGNSVDLRFTPTANRDTNASFTYAVVDSAGANSTASTATVTITAVNDAPTLTGGGTLTAVNEDTASPAGAALNTLGITASDATDTGGSVTGYAITANSSTQGAWQYSTNAGSNWHDIGTVNDTGSALALSASTLVRFVPVANYNGTPTGLTIRAIDNSYSTFSASGGTETRVTVDTSSNGGSTGISSTTQSIATSITAVNDVPTLTTITTLTGATEDTAYTITYADLVAAADEADVDGDTLVFRVEAVSTGTLTKGGNAVTAGTTTVGSGESFVWTPASHANGTLNAFTVKVVDNGAGTLASASAVQVQVTVAAVNDAPSFSGGATLTAITEDSTTPAGDTVTNLFGSLFQDANDNPANTLAGIAISADASNSTTQGKWQYSTDGGTNWNDVSTVSTSAALLLDSAAMLRFLPVANFSGMPGGLTVFAVDNSSATTFTSGVTRQTFDTTTDDATSKVSAAGVALGTSVTAVNDAPTDIALSNSNVSTFSGTTATVGTLTATDVDTGDTHTFTLVSGDGDTDNGKFTISGGTLSVDNETLAVGTYNIRVQATDNGTGNLTFQKALTVTVNSDLTVTVTDIDSSGPSNFLTDITDGTGSGLDLREALYYANLATGNVTINFLNTLAGTITLGADYTVRSGITLAMDSNSNGRSLTITGQKFTLGGTLGVSVGTGDTLTISSNLIDDDAGVESELIKTGAGTLVLGGTNNAEDTGLHKITASAGTLQVSAATNVSSNDISLSGGVTFSTTNNTLTLNNIFGVENGGATFNQTAGGHLTLSNAVNGNALIIKAGAGSMTLSNNNDALDGGFRINNGTVNATSTGKSLGNDTVTLNGGTLVISNASTFENNIDFTSDATISNAGTLTLSGVISGAGKFTKSGAGDLTLSATNTHTGNIDITAGTLIASGGSAIGNSSAVTLSGSGALQISASETIGALTGNSTAGTDVTIDNGMTLTAAYSSDATMAGVIGGAGAFTKTGAGNLTLSGANTYTGATTISAGTVTLNAGTLADASNVTVASGATLALTTADTLGSIAGAGTISLGAALTAGGSNSSTEFSGTFTGSGAFTKTGTGTLTLSGNSNSYSGAITVSAGTLLVTHNNALGGTGGNTTVSTGATLSIGEGLTIAETLSLAGSGAGSAGALRGYANTGAGSASSTITGAITLITPNATIAVDTNRTLTLSGIIGGSGGLIKSGAGTLILSAQNTYNGDSSVSAGTLLIDGQVDQNVTVASGATLGGKGTVWNGNVTVDAGGTLAPGSVSTDNYEIGSFTLNNGNLTLNGTAAFQLKGKDTAGTDFDQIDVYGAVTVGANAAITVTALNSYSLGNNTITLINNDGNDTVNNSSTTLVTNAIVSDGYLLNMAGGTDSNDITVLGNRPPVLTKSDATVEEGGLVTLSSTNLSASDPENSTTSQLVYTVATAPTKGTLFKDADGDGVVDDGESLVLNSTFTQADINDSKIKYKHGGTEEDDSITFSVTDKDSVSLTGQTLNITYIRVNDAPVLGNFSNSIAYTENGSGVVINATATVSDEEIGNSGYFNNGSLTITRQGGANGQDVFGHSGTVSALTTGGDVVVNGNTIGTVTKNSGGELSLSFSGSGVATKALVQELLRSITYSNNSDNPSTSVVLVTTINDGNTSNLQGSGGAKTAAGTTTVTVTSVNDTPTLMDLSNTQIGQKAANAGGAVGTLSLKDVDGAGNETYTISSGNGAGFFAISGNTLVTQGQVLAGTYTLGITANDGGSPPNTPIFYFTITVTDDLAPTGYGVSLSDNLVNAAERGALTMSFTGAEIGATYNYTLTSTGGGSVTGTGAVTSATQTVSAGDISSLKDGTLSVSVTLTDKASNVGTAAAATSILDATAPAGTISIADSLLNATEAKSVTLSSTGTKGGDTYSYTVTSSGGGSVSASGTWAADDGTITLADVSSLADGTLTVSLEQADKAGNTSTGAITATTILDKTPPTGTISIADNLLNATEAKGVTLTSTGTKAGDTYTYTVTSSGGGSVSGSGTWAADGGAITLADVSSLGDGTLTVSLEQADKAGNTSTGAITATTILDKTPPTGTISIADSLLNATEAKSVTLSSTGTKAGDSYTYTVTSSGGGSVSGSGAWAADGGTITLADVSSLADGTLTVSLEQADKAGNTSTGAITATTILDKTPPTGTISIADNLLNATEAKGVTLTSTGTKAGDTYTYTVTSSGGGSVSGSGTWAADGGAITLADVSSLGDGTLTVSLEQADKAGNTSTGAITATTILDKTLPTGSVNFSGTTITEAQGASLTLTSNEAGTKYSYTITSAAGGTAITGTGTLNGSSIGLPDLKGLNDGTITVTVELQDAAGNKSSLLTASTLLNLIPDNVSLTLDPGSDTGIPGDGITSNRQPTIQISGPPDSVLAVDWGDGRGFVTVGTGSGAVQSVTLDRAYEDFGDRTLRLQVTQPNGGGVILSNPLNLTLVPTPPTLGELPAINVAEDSEPISVPLSLTSPDIPVGQLSFAASSSNPDLASASVESVNGTPTLRLLPVANAFGTAQITLTITGPNGINLTRTVSYTVTGVNDAPVATISTIDARAVQGQAFNLSLPDGAFSDPDIMPGGTDRLTYSLSGPSWLVIDPATGVLSGTPASTDVGSLTVTITATDSGGLAASLTVSLAVAASNTAPVANDDSGTVREIDVLGGNVLANDTDTDAGDVLRITAVNGVNSIGTAITLASGAKVTVNADGSYSYDPNGAFGRLNNGQTGTDSFTYTVTDKTGFSSTGTVNLTITGLNNDPVTEPPKQVIIARNADAVGLSIDQPSDPDGDPLTITITGLPSNGTTLRGDGGGVSVGDTLSPADLTRLQFDVDTGFLGDAGSLTYTISDGNSLRLGSVEVLIAEEQIIGIRNAAGSASVQAEPLGNGITRFSFEVYRTAGADPATTGSVTVDFRVEAGTGISAADFAGATLPSGTVTLAPGESSRIVTIDVVGDGLTEGDETFTVALENLRNNGLTLTPRVNDPSSVSATILDRDQDRTPPRVTAVTPPDAGSYFPGDTLSVTLTFSENVNVTNGATVPLLIGSNVRLATYASGSGGNSLTFSYTVQAGDVDRDGITIGTQLGGTVKDAAGNNAVSGFALRNGAGQPLNLSNILVNTVRGKTIDGYIQGALVFADANRNGVLDNGEVNVITDAAGNYEIGGGSGPYIMVGGRDVSTGITFDGVYEAPPRATVINPLTTAVVGTAGLSASDAAFTAAATKVKTALGISSSFDLFNTDPIDQATATGSSASEVLAALNAQSEANKLSILLVQGSALLTGLSPTPLATGAAGNAITSAIGDAINALPAGGVINFADQATVQAVLANAASRLGLSPAAGLLSDTAQMIREANIRVESAENGSGSAIERLTAMARVQVVAQGDATLAIRTGAANGNLSTALAGFTGTPLDQAIAQAQVGTIVPARIAATALDPSLEEADTGTTSYRFQVTRSGSLFGTTSVNWAVSGDGGLDAADFGGTLPAGTVTFADGEAVKTITIQVTGDTTIEADERLTLSLSNASNGADIRTPTVSATILDNDPRTPTYAGPDSIAVLAGVSTSVPGLSILDGDSDNLTVTLTPTGGTIAVIGPASVSSSNGVTTLSGSVADVNATLATLIYTPAAGSTSGSLRVTASDGDASTTDLDRTLNVRVAQAPENRLPVQPVVLGGVATEIIGLGVYDTDSPTLTVSLVPTNGTVSLRTFGTATLTRDANGTVHISGATADVNASLATVDFTGSKTVREASLRIITDDNDPVSPNDSDLVFIQVVQSPEVTFPNRPTVVAGIGTPITGISLTDADTEALSVTLTPGNGSISLTAAGGVTITDAGGGALRLNGTIADLNATLAGLRFTAGADATTATLRVQAVDGDARSPDADGTLALTVAAQPAITLPSPSAIRPGIAGAVPGISVSDRDSANLTVTLTPSSGNLAIGTATNVTVSNGANGSLILSGAAAAINSTLTGLTLTLPTGTQTAGIAITASDGTTPAVSRTLTVPVIVNQPPVATANPLTLVDGRVGSAYSTVLPGNLFSDPDVGDVLSLSVSGLPAGLSFDAATNTIRGIPDFNVVGTWRLTITATDRLGEQAVRTTSLVIGQDNVVILPPPALPDTGLPTVNTTIAPPLQVAPAADMGTDPNLVGAKPIIVAGIGNTRGLFGDPLEPARIEGINLKISEPEGFVTVNVAAPGAKPYLRVGNAEPSGRLILDPVTRTASFTLPAGTFVSNDGRLAVAASMPGGKALPSWLRFDARTGTFFLREAPPANAPARMVVEVTAQTSDGQRQTVRLTLRLADRTAGIDMPTGKAPLSSAIQAAATTAIHSDGLALLNSLSSLAAGPAIPPNAA